MTAHLSNILDPYPALLEQPIGGTDAAMFIHRIADAVEAATGGDGQSVPSHEIIGTVISRRNWVVGGRALCAIQRGARLMSFGDDDLTVLTRRRQLAYEMSGSIRRASYLRIRNFLKAHFLSEAFDDRAFIYDFQSALPTRFRTTVGTEKSQFVLATTSAMCATNHLVTAIEGDMTWRSGRQQLDLEQRAVEVAKGLQHLLMLTPEVLRAEFSAIRAAATSQERFWPDRSSFPGLADNLLRALAGNAKATRFFQRADIKVTDQLRDAVCVRLGIGLADLQEVSALVTDARNPLIRSRQLERQQATLNEPLP